MRHSERCKACKAQFLVLLQRVFGPSIAGYRPGWATLPSDYRGTKILSRLEGIYAALQEHRGFTNFVRARKLAPCDFLVERGNFLVEFDESQHFTSARLVALSHYSARAPVAFSVKAWQQHCVDIDGRDNDPVFRDEQRAWYDTLRDHVPSIEGMGATVRVQASAVKWCTLDEKSRTDVEHFRGLIED